MTKEELDRKARYEDMKSTGGAPIRMFRMENYYGRTLAHSDDCLSLLDVIEMTDWTPSDIDSIANLPVGRAYSTGSKSDRTYVWRTR